MALAVNNFSGKKARMASSVKLISGYLDSDSKRDLLVKLTNDFEKNIPVICELLDELDHETLQDIYPQIEKYGASFLKNIEYEPVEKYDYAEAIFNKISQLQLWLVKNIHRTLRLYQKYNASQFATGYLRVFETNDTGLALDEEEVNKEYLISLLNFTNHFCSHKTYDHPELDWLLVSYLGIEDELVSSLALKILYWRIPYLNSHNKDELFWKAMFHLEGSGSKSIQGHCYVMWLRFLNNEDLKNDEGFQELLGNLNYWKALQKGLMSGSHEHRKFCLSILKVTISLINRDVETSLFTWKLGLNDDYKSAWVIYTTLFELLGIDTSLHQIEAAVSDLIGLMSPTSLIHASWGFGLLSLGFKASMDSVRKFSMKVLMSMPASHLYSIKHSLDILEQVFLPYMMVAAHLVVKPNENGLETCSHGEELSKFIVSILSSFDDLEIEIILESVLSVLVNSKDSFDPARIYVSSGIIQGIRDRKVLNRKSHSKYLLPLFESKSEGFLFQKTIQTINLKLLMNFKYGSVKELLELLTTLTKLNGFEIFASLSSEFLEFLKVSPSLHQELISEFNEDNEDYQDMINFFFINNLAPEVDISKRVFSKSERFWHLVLFSKLHFPLLETHEAKRFIASLITKKLELKYDPEAYDLLSRADLRFLNQSSERFDIKTLWSSICEDLKSESFLVLNSVSSKMKFLNSITEATGSFISSHEVLDLKNSMLCNSKEVSKNHKNFYKVQDEIYSAYYRTLMLAYSHSKPSEEEAEKLINMLESDSTHYESNLSIIKLMTIVLEVCQSSTLLEMMAKFIYDLWQNLTESRLQLNQKELQVQIINLLYDSKIIKESCTDSAVSEICLNFGKSVINNAHGRRSLLPALTKKLSDLQISNEYVFEEVPWVPEVIVEAFVLYQLRNNSFKLEIIIGRLFDETLSLDKNYNLYESIYGPLEISSKINLMAILNSINNENFALRVFNFIIENESKFNLFTVKRKTDGLEEWVRIQLFSILVSVTSLIDKNRILNDFEYIDQFVELLGTEPSPLVRVYLEWLIALNLDEDFTERIFKVLIDENNNLKPSIMTSYERILFLMIREKLDPKEWIFKLLAIIIPGSSSNKALTRHFSLSLVCSIYNEVLSRKIDIEPFMLSILENTFNTVVKSESYGQFRSGDAILWDIKDDLNLVTISGGLLLRLSDRTDFDFILKETYYEHLTTSQLKHLKKEVGENHKHLWVKEKFTKKKSLELKESNNHTPLQTKSGAWSSLMEFENIDHDKEISRSDLIVVSSLVDKPPNLGGICRLCDVLGAGVLTLNDIKVKTHPQFKNVAVTADQWMPMIEVKPDSILSFLQEKKKKGYYLIGLEQTDNSIELNSKFNFPKKSLIVLGAEKEGIRGDILAELDVCLEIKQVGVIRSMNIQTATAIIVHAYSSQHC